MTSLFRFVGFYDTNEEKYLQFNFSDANKSTNGYLTCIGIKWTDSLNSKGPFEGNQVYSGTDMDNWVIDAVNVQYAGLNKFKEFDVSPNNVIAVPLKHKLHLVYGSEYTPIWDEAIRLF